MKLLPPALLILALATPTVSMAAVDARVRSIRFTPDTVVPFAGKLGYQSTIRFGPDERIENVAVGDSVAWQVTPNKRGDLLFVKPLVAGSRSNMTVITDKRTYLFDLEAPRQAQPVYALSFEYPAWPNPGAVAPPAEPEPVAVETAAAPVSTPPPPPPRLNFAWVSRGAKALLPARAFDDGRSLYLSWPQQMPLPAVLIPGTEGGEGPVNYRVEAEYIVIDGVPEQLILRRGKERAVISPAGKAAKPVRSASSGDGR